MCFCFFVAGFNPDVVGTEGQGFIWEAGGDSDDEREQVGDIWGE